jgi:8-oxo-dGTP pyrophosphatase MutT (NUDIX family)/RimJ/RimL family protein N-acetyltransferase
MTNKVVAYITQGDKLLVFSHPMHPKAGIQVPAGTIEDNESPEQAALREAREETGLHGLEMRSFLGVREHDLSLYGIADVHQRYFFHLECRQETPTTWHHHENDPSDESPAPIEFEFFWVKFPDEVPELSGELGELLPKLVANGCQETIQRTLTFRPIDEATARVILGWRYEPPYDIYDPSFGDFEEAMQVFLDPQNAYHAITDEHGHLVAYCCFGPDGQVPGGNYRAAALDIGLGMRPDLTGQGRGLAYVNAVLDFARRTFSPTAFRVTVAKFNQRALRVWEKAGFQPVQTFQKRGDGTAFVILSGPNFALDGR